MRHPLLLWNLLAACVVTAGPCVAQNVAQNFPVKALRYVVPTAAGGSSDTLARIVAPRLAELLGQAIVIDNRPGANGIIGAEIVARAPADGHTLLQAATSHATNPATGAKLPYDTLRDFAPITLLSQQPNLWIAHPSLPVRDIKGLIALAKARPTHIDFASSGTGSSQHLAGELLNVLAGIQLTHVPYKGSPQALMDVLGGRVAVMVSTIAPAMPMVKSARLRALAITSAQRSRAASDVPTVAESGVANYEAISWQGVLAPGGAPRNVVQRLNSDLSKVLAMSEPQRQLAEQGYEPRSDTPEAFVVYIQSEIAKWTRVVRAAGIKIQ